MSTIKVDTVRPVTTDADLVLQGDSSGAGVTGAKVFGDGSLGANSITDLAGTDAPDFPYGLTLASNATGGNITGVTLDDYEEGTWTPTIAAGHTIGGYSTKYTKIGRIVHVYGSIDFTSINNTSASAFSIGGLPFAADAIGNNLGTISRAYGSSPIFPSAATSDFTGLQVASTGFFLCKASRTSTSPFLLYTDCNSSGQFNFGLTYFTS